MSAGLRRNGLTYFQIDNTTWDEWRLGLRRSNRTFKTLDQLETVIWQNLPIFTNPKSVFVDDIENFDPLKSSVAYKSGLYWCEGECNGRNLISPRVNERICVFCGQENTLSRDNEFEFRPNRQIFEQVYPNKFNPFMNWLRKRFAEEPHLAEMGIDLGIKTFRSGMRARHSIVIQKRPFLEVRKGFEYGVLYAGSDNRFSIPSISERLRKDDILGSYRKNYLSKDPKPLQPSFTDTSFLLGPETEFPTYFPVTPWAIAKQ